MTMHVRERRIPLPGNITAEQAASLSARFTGMDDIVRFRFNGGRLEIAYHFPSLSLGEILDLLLVQASAPGFPSLRQSFIAWMENNERDHLVSHGGWNAYLQDVYVEDFRRNLPQSGSQKKKQWQQYRPPHSPDEPAGD